MFFLWLLVSLTIFIRICWIEMRRKKWIGRGISPGIWSLAIDVVAVVVEAPQLFWFDDEVLTPEWPPSEWPACESVSCRSFMKEAAADSVRVVWIVEIDSIRLIIRFCLAFFSRFGSAPATGVFRGPLIGWLWPAWRLLFASPLMGNWEEVIWRWNSLWGGWLVGVEEECCWCCCWRSAFCLLAANCNAWLLSWRWKAELAANLDCGTLGWGRDSGATDDADEWTLANYKCRWLIFKCTNR